MSGLSLGCFRALLTLYPRPHRRRFGDEMTEVFLARLWEARRRRGRLGELVLWMRTLPGLVRGAVESRLGRAGRRDDGGAPPPPPPPRRAVAVGSWMEDLRFALRLLVRRPGTTVAAVVTLALGIGANATIFSVVDAVLLRPLPAIDDPDRLVALYTGDGTYEGVSSYMDYRDFRERRRAFAELAAYKRLSMDLTADGVTERVAGQIVTGTYFPMLGVEPAAGRLLGPADDDEVDGEPVAVLGHGLWTRRFAAAPGVVGDTVRLNGRAFTVVGVAPEGFRGTDLGEAPELFAPMMMQPHFMPAYGSLLDRRGWGGVMVLGRLAPGAGLAEARSEIGAAARSLRETYPATNSERRYRLVPFSEARLPPVVRGVAVRAGLLLLGVVTLVLAVAAINVANLLLARAAERRGEVAVRQALGARRGRIVRQLLVESGVLALAGGAAGVLVAAAGTGLLAALPLPLPLDARLDLRVLAYSLAVACGTGLLFGLVPAWRLLRADPAGELKREPRSGGGRGRLGRTLIVGQVASSLLVLACAALFARTLVHLESLDPGFRTEGLAVVTLDPSLQGYSMETIGAFYERLLEEARGLPGASAAALVNGLPGPHNDNVINVLPEGAAGDGDGGVPLAVNVVTPGYFDTFGILVLEGRPFASRDDPRAESVLVVNRRAARRLEEATGRPALGSRLSFAGPDGPWARIVGVVGDTRALGVRAEAPPLVYAPLAQALPAVEFAVRQRLVVRTAGEVAAMLPAMRDLVRRLDPRLPVIEATTVERHLAATLVAERYVTVALAAFAALAVALAAVGLHGVLACSVARRSRELGVRMALGATRAELRGMVTRQGLTLVGLGVLLGLVAAGLAARLLDGLLAGVQPLDPLTYAAASAFLLAVAVAASYLPARRATSVDPVEALRRE